MPERFTQSSFDDKNIIGHPDSKSLERGMAYWRAGTVTLVEDTGDQVLLHVRGSRATPYEVIAWLDRGKTWMSCDCPFAEDEAEIICKHKVAVTAFMRHLLPAPRRAAEWEQALTTVVQTLPVKPKPRTNQILLFSLQQGYPSWKIVPYSLSASNFDNVDLTDVEAVHKRIWANKLSSTAKDIHGRFEPSKYLNVTEGAEMIAEVMTYTEQLSRYYYSNRALAFTSLFRFLKDSLFFYGDSRNPFKTPIHIRSEIGRLETAVVDSNEAMQLQSVITLGDDKIVWNQKTMVLISDDPIWILAGKQLFALEETSPAHVTLLRSGDLTIPKQDQDIFKRQYLPKLAEQVRLHSDHALWETVDEAPVPRLYLTEVEGEMQVQLRFGYGTTEVLYKRDAPPESYLTNPETDSGLVKLIRHPGEELTAWESLSRFGLRRGTSPEMFLLRAKTDPIDFLLHQIPKLTAADFEVYGEEELKSLKINRSKPNFTFSVSSGIDWFDVKAVATFGDNEVPLSQIKHALRKREKYLKLADGSIGAIPEEWLERYRHLFAFGQDTDDGVRLSQHHVALLDQLEAEGDHLQADQEFQKRRERLQHITEIVPVPLPEGLVATLRPYQKAGYDWLHFLHDNEFGGCLADDMGIGKTIQALTFLLSLRESGKAQTANLIVLPRSLLFNWEREAQKFTPSLRVLMHSENHRYKDVAEFENYDLVLTTYGVMLRDIEILRGYNFHYALLDEAQAIKNPASQTAKAARLIRSDHRLTLTGTPVENSTVELWSQFAFLNPGLLGSLEYFREQFANAIEKHQDEASAQLLRKLVFPFILRRTKDQVAPELPPRTERVLLAEMDKAQHLLYTATRDKYRAELLELIETDGMNSARMRVLEALLRLRQIANHPQLVDPKSTAGSAKFEMLLETLETLQSEGHKALIFSQFVTMLTLLRTALDARKIRYAYLDGKTKDRQARVDTFQSDPTLPFFLISLKAGGVGLNLTAADYVIHIDPWWNPAVERQATDRTHRIGQDKPVFVYKLITRETVEEKILELQDRKRLLADQLVATEEGFFKALNADDIGALLG